MLPSIGKKSAMRMAFHILNQDKSYGLKLCNALEDALYCVTNCQKCGFISEHELCEICQDEQKDHTWLCIVQDSKDILVVEQTRCYSGYYFVMDSINQDKIQELISIVKSRGTLQILFAISPSIANDSFILFVEDKLKDKAIKFHKIAQGVPTGVGLENVDILSVAKAIDGKMKV
jgi:recombination protein RecR